MKVASSGRVYLTRNARSVEVLRPDRTPNRKQDGGRRVAFGENDRGRSEVAVKRAVENTESPGVFGQTHESTFAEAATFARLTSYSLWKFGRGVSVQDISR
jgi:hypothetical protein